jgi:hypothetical protein
MEQLVLELGGLSNQARYYWMQLCPKIITTRSPYSL